MSWVFLTKQEVLKIHADLIDQTGGSHGLRDEGLLESALAASENRLHYENASLPICAATYAYHLTKAHAFIDGNKRVAAAVSEIFLRYNGAKLIFTTKQVVDVFLAIAADQLTRTEVEDLFLAHIVLPNQ